MADIITLPFGGGRSRCADLHLSAFFLRIPADQAANLCLFNRITVYALPRPACRRRGDMGFFSALADKFVQAAR
jgi:hypothetical protein